MTITIRQAVRDDATEILLFQMALALETEGLVLDKLVLSKGIAAVFDDPAKGVYYVAEYGNEVAGCFLITYEWSEWRNATIWWLQSVYVKAPHRRKGIFRHMYEYIIDAISREPTVAGLRLYVDTTNKRAQQVYEALGMEGNHYALYEKIVKMQGWSR